MNTNDIRNTEQDQSLFWQVAVPVTALVVGLAFLYAYWGAQIEDRLLSELHTQGNKSNTKQMRDWPADSFANSPRPWHLKPRRKRKELRRITDDSFI